MRCYLTGVPTAASWNWGLALYGGRTLSARCLRRPGARRAVFPRGHGQRRCLLRAHYRRAALVLWPRGGRLAVLNQAGLAVTLPYLGDLTGRWTQSGEGPASPLWREAHELSGHMLRAWPRQVGWYPGRTEARSDAATLLTLLSQLQDTARIDTFWTSSPPVLTARATTRRSSGPPVSCRRSGPRRCSSTHRQPGGDEPKRVRRPASPECRRAGYGARGGPQPRRHRAGRGLAGRPGTYAAARPLGPITLVEAGFLVDLLTALGQIDVALADRAVDCILAWPQTYEPDAVLVPAVLGLTGPAAHQAAAVQRLRTAALEHLRPYRRTAGATTRLGTGALSRARARIAANSATSWRIPTASVGRLRPLKPGAVTWRSRSSGAAATWTW